jgi:hypothetical protein
MADKILRNKIIKGKITFPPSSESDTWLPFDICNDFYPKIVTDIENDDFSSSSFEYYEQKNIFKEIILSKNKMVIEPVVAGWGITFENITIFYKNKKYLIHSQAIQDKDIKFNDSFYRFSSMYTFENKINATEETKREFLIKSWKYNK